jgi:hypothetical protein
MLDLRPLRILSVQIQVHSADVVYELTSIIKKEAQSGVGSEDKKIII